MKDILIPYGLRDGELIHVSQVESGLSHRCACPACGSKLVARKGTIRVHHFGHYSETACKDALETTLHIMAKSILAKRMRMMIPDLYVGTELLANKKMTSFDRVELETRLGNIVPDVVVYKGEKLLLIEIFVTHHREPESIRQAGYSTIEVDLSWMKRFPSQMELEKIVVAGSEYKKWLYNTRVEELRRWASSLALAYKPKWPSKESWVVTSDGEILDTISTEDIWDDQELEDRFLARNYVLMCHAR